MVPVFFALVTLLLLPVVSEIANERPQTLAFVTTYCAGHDAIAGVHVLAESLLRSGHRGGLRVIVSPQTNADELALLARAPLARVTRAPLPEDYCPNRAMDECSHLVVSVFDPTIDIDVDAGVNIVLLAPTTVVLNSLSDLAEAAAFSAVRSEHEDGFDTDTIVLRRDATVHATLREKTCDGEDALRTAVPFAVWSPLDDIYGVPADHLDTVWYKQSGAVPRVVRFGAHRRPWSWWLSNGDGVRLSLSATAHWCEAAAHTPFSCGWGDGEDDAVIAEIAPNPNLPPTPPPTPLPVPLRAPSEPSSSSTAQKFAVLLSTYSRPTWRALVKHYAMMKAVQKVYLVWHNPTADAPAARELGNNIIVLRAGKDSLNNRYSAPGISEAVYVCDDDMWVHEKALTHAFGVWKAQTRRLVGLFPRRWSHNDIKYSAKIHNGYNIVLTKGVFVHRAYLYMYTRLLPKRVKDIVDKHNNCEDILLNIVVTRYTQLAPVHVLVEEPVLDLGHHSGISKRGMHFTLRRLCVEDIVDQLNILDWTPPITNGSMSVRPLKNREIK